MAMAFKMANHHAKSCGNPPAWTTAAREPCERRSYFENTHGEQWVASATKARFRVTGGDNDWRTIEIANPDYMQIARQASAAIHMPLLPGVGPMEGGCILASDECLWIISICASVDRTINDALLSNQGRLPVLAPDAAIVMEFMAVYKKGQSQTRRRVGPATVC